MMNSDSSPPSPNPSVEGTFEIPRTEDDDVRSDIERDDEPHQAPAQEAPRRETTNAPQRTPLLQGTKFRFEPQDPPPPALDTIAACDPHPFWQIVLLMVACVNLRFHLPHRACNLILQVLKVIFTHLKLFNEGHKPAVTLNTTFSHLGLRDAPFDILPMCATCHRIFPADTIPDSECSHCEIPLFKSVRIAVSNFDGNTEEVASMSTTPILKVPFRAISCQLAEFLNRKGIEDACDEWRTKTRTFGVLTDIMDGEKWKTVEGPDGRPFFDNNPNRESKDELRIAVTLGFDG